jgi:hypothetical protein
LEHESHPHHHPHGTGFRWLDITLSVAATVVSLVSLWLGIHSGHAMEKLVAANSYPYLEQDSSNMSSKPMAGTDHLRRRIEYGFTNNGVGPARIEWVQLTFKGKPMADITELLAACCSGTGNDSNAMDFRGSVAGSLVRPGASLSLFDWPEQDKPNPLFNSLYQHMDDIAISYCYCSVFDECYARHAESDRPAPVEQCKAPAVTFRPGYRKHS